MSLQDKGDTFMKTKIIFNAIVGKMTLPNKSLVKFLSHLVFVILSARGRKNFTNMARWSSYNWALTKNSLPTIVTKRGCCWLILTQVLFLKVVIIRLIWGVFGMVACKKV